MADEKPAELVERCAQFGETAIRFAKGVKRSVITNPLISQLVRSATSVGANYCEARNASSRKDFFHRVSIAQREALEAKHWLRMIVAADDEYRTEARNLWKEANELHLILSSILVRRVQPERTDDPLQE
jgi:four helix bundle protein